MWLITYINNYMDHSLFKFFIIVIIINYNILGSNAIIFIRLFFFLYTIICIYVIVYVELKLKRYSREIVQLRSPVAIGIYNRIKYL